LKNRTAGRGQTAARSDLSQTAILIYATSSTFRLRHRCLTIHHLGHSQSERIVWLCEELGIPYELRHYQRDAVTRLSPPELKALHPLGAAPLIEDDGLLLAESAAIVEYIMARHGGEAPARTWASRLPGLSVLVPFLERQSTARDRTTHDGEPRRFAGGPSRAGFSAGSAGSRDADRGCAPARGLYFAGREFTAADIMSVFSLTTMRLFQPVDLRPYPGILTYLQRIGGRPAYRRAMAKGDPDLVPMLD
jgi:glutathione S-transferase